MRLSRSSRSRVLKLDKKYSPFLRFIRRCRIGLTTSPTAPTRSPLKGHQALSKKFSQSGAYRDGGAAGATPPRSTRRGRSMRPWAVGLIVRPLARIAVRMEVPRVPSRIGAAERVGGTYRHQHDRGNEGSRSTNTPLHRSTSFWRAGAPKGGSLRIGGAPPLLADNG